MDIQNNVLELIGNTPMLHVRSFDTGPCTLLLKLESQNPGGSIKDRIGRSMIEAAEREEKSARARRWWKRRRETPAWTALVAASKGYQARAGHSRQDEPGKAAAFAGAGGTIVMTRSDVGKGHPQYYQDLADIAGKRPGRFTSISSTTRPIRSRTSRPRVRKSGSKPITSSTRSFAAWVRRNNHRTEPIF